VTGAIVPDLCAFLGVACLFAEPSKSIRRVLVHCVQPRFIFKAMCLISLLRKFKRYVNFFPIWLSYRIIARSRIRSCSRAHHLKFISWSSHCITRRIVGPAPAAPRRIERRECKAATSSPPPSFSGDGSPSTTANATASRASPLWMIASSALASSAALARAYSGRFHA
jgi:hypothetical protein